MTETPSREVQRLKANSVGLVGVVFMAVATAAPITVLLVVNLDTAAGTAADSLFFKAIPWIVGLVFFGGLGLGFYLKARRPERYDIIGRIVLEDAAERTDDDVTEASATV